MKNIIGFQICGIGNGHLTQAKVVYDIMIKRYDIPIVVIYGRQCGYDGSFADSLVVYEHMFTTPESINNNDMLLAMLDTFGPLKMRNWESKFQINKWINFWVIDYYNLFHTKQIIIANQFTVDSIELSFLTASAYALTNTVLVSIHLSSRYTNHVIPPLISIEHKIRTSSKKPYILAYSVSGTHFLETLIQISDRNPHYTIRYYTLTKFDRTIPKTIELHEPDKEGFAKDFCACSAVLCTSGNQLILECIYNEVPVATMPCSDEHFEQNSTFEKYVYKLRYAKRMHSKLSADLLVKRDLRKYTADLKDALKEREAKVLNLVTL